MNRPHRDDAGPRHFPTTRWTLVHSAGDTLNAHQRDALNEVLTDYWPAIRAHLISNKGIDPHEADDLVQGFIKDRVLERDLLKSADRDRGRFRSFLVKALENYAANEVRRRAAQKRHPQRAISLDSENSPAPNTTMNTPPKLADAAWARDTLELVLERMREECHLSEREALWDLFESRIVAPIFEGGEPIDYEQILRRDGSPFSSTAQAQNALVTAKRLFCRIMRTVLRERGTAEAEVDSEIRDLERCLAGY